MPIVKVRKTGTALAVTIPKALNVALAKDRRLAAGDYVNITLTAKARFEFEKVKR